jgi:hypothetical protein
MLDDEDDENEEDEEKRRYIYLNTFLLGRMGLTKPHVARFDLARYNLWTPGLRRGVVQ